MTISDRESRWLEIVIYERRILLAECDVLPVCEGCILKILSFKQNVDCSLVEVTEKTFQASKFILKSPKLTD